MKRRLFLVFGCLIALFFSTAAYSAAGPYVSGNIGMVIPEDSDVTDSTYPGVILDTEFDTGMAIGMAAGYAFDYNFRLEAEITYQQTDFDKGSIAGVGSTPLSGDASCFAFLVNFYYDFKNSSRFIPFISAGVGIAYAEVDDFNAPGSGYPSASDDDTVFAYQLGAGVGYAVSETVLIDCKYRYFALDDPDFDTTTAEYASHNIYLGLRLAF